MSNNVLNPYQTFYDATGQPRANGKVTFYENNTTTLASIYSDEALTVAQANPYTLDAYGRITGDVKYTSVLTLKIQNEDLSDVRTDNDVATTESPASSVSVKAANYTTVLGDHNGTIEVSTASVTITLLAIASATTGYTVRVKNSSGSTTIVDATGSETIDGSATAITLQDDEVIVVQLNQAETGYNIIQPVGMAYLADANAFTGANTYAGTSTHSAIQSLSEGANIASATDCDIWANLDGNTVHLTGTTTVTDWGTAPQAGVSMMVICDAATPLTYNATTNDLNGGVSYTCAAGDVLHVYARSTSSYKVTVFPYSGEAIATTAPTAAQGASMVLLSTQTASASATVDFTTGIDGTYDHYIVFLTDIRLATNGANLLARLSQAATFIATNYNWMGDESFPDGTDSILGGSLDTSFKLTNSVDVTNAYTALTGEIHFSSPDNTSYDKRFWGKIQYGSTANSVKREVGCSHRSTVAMDGLRFLSSSGNITSGVFRLYGIKDS